MAYAVQLTLDPTASERVTALWQDLADKGINDTMIKGGFVPHVSLAVYPDDLPDEVGAVLTSIADEVSPLDIMFRSIGLFPGPQGALFLAPKQTHELIRIAELYHERARAIRSLCNTLYLPRNWVAHCTLAHPIDEENAARALNEIPALSTHWQPFAAKFKALELIQIDPMETLMSFELKAV